MVARAAEFQAAWYYSLLLFAILLIIVVCAAYAAAGIRSLWRGGDRGPAAALAGAVAVALLALGGMYVVAIGGLLAIHGAGS
jgi:hypothetical protein